MEKILIIANWKCNPITLQEAKRLFNSVAKGIKNIKRTEVVICPPFVWLSNLLASKPYILNPKLGAQDCFWEDYDPPTTLPPKGRALKGAFTGEISPSMLKNIGIKYVIIGHSERRKYQKETDEMLNKKLKAVLRVGLKAILCIDNISQIPSFLRKRGGRRGRSPLRPKKDLSGLAKKELLNLIIAYEPIFAIGTGKPCSIEKAKKMRISITRALAKGGVEEDFFFSTFAFSTRKLGEERMFFDKREVLNENTPILYGGSVNSQNAENYIKEGGFQGLLIGSTSLNAKEFIKIVKDIDLN